jgi:hypothetical protein
MRAAGRRLWIDAGASALCGLILVLTLAWPDWIELVLGVDPDRSSGALEWGIALAAAGCTAAFVALARRDWRAQHAT